jgi:hypothetical protein
MSGKPCRLLGEMWFYYRVSYTRVHILGPTRGAIEHNTTAAVGDPRVSKLEGDLQLSVVS